MLGNDCIADYIGAFGTYTLKSEVIGHSILAIRVKLIVNSLKKRNMME